ncbi:MAG TPA: zf-HC2 domain-containing protein, partial [Pyrinomonadaceae bacterium]|nr:zf-HC2 domain-containing protein [Pyrinomonadaceae bacterium]
MLCADFEDRLTDYLDGALEGEEQRACAEHALRCPVCHDLLNEVRNAIVECRESVPPQPSPELEARILLKTAPETSMSCEEFEEYLTDYLDGFLPAPLYHRWERHAALCQRCSDLPGQVVRAIGACYSYISEEK